MSNDFENVYLQRAQTLRRLGRFAEAMQEYVNALAEDPNSTQALCGLASLQIITKDYVAAEQNISLAVELAPDFAYPYYLLSYIEANRNNNATAACLAETAIQLDPHDVDYHHRLGEIYHLNEMPGPALESAIRAMEINPEHQSSILLRANSLLALDRKAEARAFFDFALASDPEHAEAHMMLGRFELEHSSNNAVAAERLSEARRIDPISSNDLESIALAYGKMMPTIMLLDRFILKLYKSHFQRCLFAFIINIVSVLYGMSHGLFSKDKVPGPWWWTVFCIAIANYLALCFSFEHFTRLAAMIYRKRNVGLYIEKSTYFAPIFMIFLFHFFACCIGYGATSDGGILLIFSFMLAQWPLVISTRKKLTNANETESSTFQTIAFVVLLMAGMFAALGIAQAKQSGPFYAAVIGYALYWAAAFCLNKFTKYLGK